MDQFENLGESFLFVENTVELLKRIIFVLFITETMAKNNLLSEQLAYIGVSCTPTHLHLCSYNAESICMKDGKDIDSLIPYLNKNAINWIQIHGFQNTEVIQHVCQNFNVDF